MDSETIKSLITAAFPDATVSVELSGGHCDLVVVSTSFEGDGGVVGASAEYRSSVCP